MLGFLIRIYNCVICIVVLRCKTQNQIVCISENEVCAYVHDTELFVEPDYNADI